MKLRNKIKQVFQKWQEKLALIELWEFMCERGYFPKNLKNRQERVAYKQNLTATYTYQKGDDLLARKQDFIEKYTTNEQEQLQYFTQTPVARVGWARCKAWRDHEQVERNEAQKAWHQVTRRNYHDHMHQKFMNQKTR